MVVRFVHERFSADVVEASPAAAADTARRSAGRRRPLHTDLRIDDGAPAEGLDPREGGAGFHARRDRLVEQGRRDPVIAWHMGALIRSG